MEDILRIERETRKFRLLAVFFVAAGFQFQRNEIPILPAVALATVYLVYLSVSLFTIIKRVPPRLVPYLMLAVDAAFVIGTLHIFGVNSPAFVLLPVLIVYYAIYLRYTAILLCATVMASAYIGMAFLQGADSTLGRMLPVQIPLLYLLALFAGHGAQQRRHVLREREELEVLLKAERGARALLETTAGFAETVGNGSLLGEIAQVFTFVADCEYCSLRLIDEAGALDGVSALFPASAQGDGARPKAGLAATTELERQCLERREIVEILAPEAKLAANWAALTPSYALIVPLVSSRAPVGVMLLLDTRPHPGLSDQQRELINRLASTLSTLADFSLTYALSKHRTQRITSELRGAVQHLERRKLLEHRDNLRVGQLLLEPARQAVSIDGQRLELSAKEFDILYLLGKHAGKPVSQETFLREVWGGQGTRSNLIDVAINRLRRKLDEQAHARDLILTLRGKGYVLDNDHAVLQIHRAQSSTAKQTRQGQRGSLLLENVISLAIIAVLVPALIAALVGVLSHSFAYSDRTLILELVQSQMENIKKQAFQNSPANYGLISLPADYSLSVATSEAQAYRYTNGATAPEVLQSITVTVTGYNGSLVMNGYRYKE